MRSKKAAPAAVNMNQQLGGAVFKEEPYGGNRGKGTYFSGIITVPLQCVSAGEYHLDTTTIKSIQSRFNPEWLMLRQSTKCSVNTTVTLSRQPANVQAVRAWAIAFDAADDEEPAPTPGFKIAASEPGMLTYHVSFLIKDTLVDQIKSMRC
jgi:hypothetical protein